MKDSKNRIPGGEDTPESLPTEYTDGFPVRLAGDHSVVLGSMQRQGKREYQEDSCGFSELTDDGFAFRNGLLAVLSDGMGGLSNGKEVSRFTVDALTGAFNEAPASFADSGSLRRAAETVNTAVCRRYSPDGRITAGATLVAALLRGDAMHWLTVGDSRIYLKRGGRLYQVNEDHDYLNRLLEGVMEGGVTEAEAFGNPQKDALVGCIGNPALIADRSRRALTLAPGDIVLLCSDGVYNALPPEELCGLLAPDAQRAADRMAQAVEAYGYAHQDNYTAVIISFLQ